MPPMINWYNNLTLLQRIFALIALPSTAVLLIQTIMLFFGLGNDSDVDIDGDGVPDVIADGDGGLTLFSIRGIMAMLCIGSWSGIAISEAGVNGPLTILFATLIGLAALFGMALLIKVLFKLQSSGNIQLSNAIGKVGQVYLPIPAKMSGMGKVNITIQDKYSEFSAMTTEETPIKTGEMVRVVATDEVGYLLVERIVK